MLSLHVPSPPQLTPTPNTNKQMKVEQLYRHHPPLFLCDETWEWDYETESLVEDPGLLPEFGAESAHGPPSAPPPTVLDHDFHWDPQELPSLLSKQELANHSYGRGIDLTHPRLLEARDDAVDWIMKVHASYSFSAPTAVLAVDCLDRFLVACFGTLGDDKPWTTQLSAVACLSLAAKVEETRVPLLLDFQVEESCYVFEAKTIQRMEVVVLSSLQWRMNPVTPLSFLDFAIRRFGFKDMDLCWAFRSRFEKLLLSILPECRFVGYLPSVLAAAIMLHVAAALKLDLDVVGLLGTDKEAVYECYEFVADSTSRRRSSKRKFGPSSPGGSSPRGVMEAWCSCSDSSNDSWGASEGSYSPEPNRRRFQSPYH
ncbi:hypothetical protein MLD38_002055 [Melastoma candidum]|uniref:Uncharacterized protein n=1 Tax=Melastoma candidum TaxID=119954 RepID=A0ACB9SGH9_9MYRT|nr:hypothetical protein MLD38_002055 [Melastoma candidum]